MTAPAPGPNPGARGAAGREARRDPALILLGALAAAPLVPSPWSVAVLAVAAALLLWRRPPLREALAIAIGAAIAFVLLAAAFVLERRPMLPQPAAQRLAVERYTEVWRELQEAVESAVAAAAAIGVPPRDDSARLQMFHALGKLSESRRHAGLTFLLFDPDGSVSAWAGEGLLHEPAPESLLTAGAQYIEGFGSATLLAVRPVPLASAASAPAAPPATSGEGPRPWRLVAGRSLATDALPFEPPGEIARASYRWSFLPAGAPLAAGAVRVAAPGAPAIGVSLASSAAAPAAPAAPMRAGSSERLRRAAGFAVGLILLALGTMRAVGTAVLSRTVVRGAPRAGAVSALVAGGAVAWAWAGGAPPPALVALAAAALLAALLAQVARGAAIPAAAPDSASTAAAFALGVLAVAVLAGLVHALLFTQGLYDLGSALAGGAQAIVLRLACATAAFGLFYGGSRLTSRLRQRESWAWASAGLLLLGAAFHDSTWIAALAAAAGGGALVVWLAGARPLRRPLTAATALILSALAAALTWETVYRLDLRAEMAVTASRLGPPDASETAALSTEMEDFVTGLDLAALVPRDPRALDRQDLAYRLWRHSPVARRNALSALVVVGADGGRSAFSFGLPISSDGEPLAEAGAWEALVPAGWEAAAVAGEAMLDVAGETFGVVRYWLLPLPGFRLGGRETEDVRLALLRGGPARLGIEGLPAPALLALYGADGRIRPSGLGSPWPERPPLDPVLAAAGAARVDTPDGPAWGWTAPADAVSDRAAAGSRLALYLPALGPRAALDRVGTHALGVVLLLFAGALLALLLGLPRAAFRDALRRALRSYSQRLILVYSLLLLLPLLIASALLVRRFEARSAAEQRAHGDQALLAAGRVLGQYLGTLTPGFGLGTAIDDPLLAWLAGVVRHDVSLYWGSGVYASSRRELFTAGLLPKRIPGEVSARLRLLGYGLAGRTRQVGDTAYLEVYSHLEVPGGGAAGSSLSEDLALSVPLLAQQEDAAAELDSLRRQAVLVTAALFLLLVALGTRLARGFTQPLQELVHGTQRIAAGAAELGLRPAELELAALAEAIDRMANKIAEGRERLVREKQVVERVVENITAGVVSLDEHGRVLMANRVAVELMAPVVGEPLSAALRRRPQLAPLAAFLESWSAETRQTTVRIAAAGGDQGGEREWTAIWAPVPGAGEPAALLVVEDSTEVLRGQRLLAWAEMARIIAHEIKNPLTPIRLSAEHMREVYGRDPERFAPVFERCTTNILKQVEELRAIASEFSIYSHIPALQAQPGNLLETVRAVVEAYAAAPPPGVVVRSTFADGELGARFDPRLLGRALRNVLENAVRASVGGGEVLVAVEAAADAVAIAVSDQGPGVPEADLARIFDPYFSTHAGGTGLGLPIARRIVEEHGGRVAARNRPEGGFEVSITIPR